MFSEQEGTLLGIIVIIYFIFLFIVSLFISRSIKTYDDYNVAGRTVSIFPLILTFVGTAVGGSTLLGYMENGYQFGMGQQWLNIGTLITGTIMIVFLIKRIRKMGEKHQMVTIGDFTALRFGEGARPPTVISMLVAYCAITGMQFVAIATILNLTIGLSMAKGILISWALITLKTYFGGLKSVIWQDAFHGTIQTLGVFTLFVVVLVVAGDFKEISAYADSLGETNNLSLLGISPSEVFVYVLTIGAYQLIRQDLWQRFWAAKSIRVATNGYLISIILSFLTGVFVVMIGVWGLFGLKIEDITPTHIYYAVIGEVFPFPVVVLMIVALLATVISTADSFFMAGSSSIVNDVIRPRMKSENNQKLLRYSRLSVVLVSIIALLLALYIPELVELWVTGTAMLVSGLLAPVLFGLFWEKTTNKAGITAMWVGLSVAVIWQLLGQPFGVHPVFLGLPLSTLLVIVISFLNNKRSVELIDESSNL